MKLVTWNTQWCRGLDGVVDPRRIVEGARALADFDVLCLQEVASGFDRMPGQPGDQPSELEALLPGFSFHFGAAVDEWHDGRRRRFGNAVATRLPVALVEHHPLPWPPDPAKSSMPRMATVVTVADPALGPVRIVTTHLEYYSARQRSAQAAALRALQAQACALAAAPPKPPEPEDANSPFEEKVHTPHAVLCGDFNAPAGDATLAAIERRFRRGGGGVASGRWHNAWPLRHGRSRQPPTFRAIDSSGGKPMGCDLVFVSDALAPRVTRIEIDRATRASDHQPVVVEIG